jgi:hypothetical protein
MIVSIRVALIFMSLDYQEKHSLDRKSICKSRLVDDTRRI